MTRQCCAHVEGTHITCARFESLPRSDGTLTDICLLLVTVELEIARFSHDIDAGLPWILLSLLVDAARVGVHLLRLQVYVRTDQVRVAVCVLQIRLLQVQQGVDFFYELGAHSSACDLS